MGLRMNQRGVPKTIDYSNMDMDFITLGFDVRPVGRYEFDGKRLRSALGPASRRLACERPNVRCNACDMRAGCLYALLYEPGTISTGSGPKTPPKPYVLRRIIWKNGVGTIEYLLFGPAMDFARMFGVAVVNAIHSIGDYQVNPGVSNWMNGDDSLFRRDSVSKYIKKRIKELDKGVLRVDILTSLRLKSNGKTFSDVTIERFASFIGRRARLLLGFYGYDASGHGIDEMFEMPDQINGLKTESFMAWKDDHRYSARQGRSMPTGGITGYMKITGIDSKGLGLLALGELLNIGSMTNMGHGAIELRRG